MKNETHEQSIEEHVRGNLAMAIDQQEEYADSPGWNAFDAYSQNTCDSILEDGYSPDDAANGQDWFWTLAYNQGFKGSLD